MDYQVTASLYQAFAWAGVGLLGLCAGTLINIVSSRLPELRHYFPGYTGLTRGQRCMVVIMAVVLSIAVFAVYGVALETLFVWGACLTLLTLAVIDLRTHLLLDVFTLPLLWAGLLYHLVIHPAHLADAVAGAMAGYLMLWSIFWMFKLTTGKDGMGYGDFKLMAALGAWLGWQFTPIILVLSAGIGAVVGIVVMVAVPRLRGAPLAFGPWLAVAGWLALLFGEPLMDFYLRITPQ